MNGMEKAKTLIEDGIRAGWESQKAFAAHVGMSESSISNFLRGKRSISLAVFERILEALDLEIVPRSERKRMARRIKLHDAALEHVIRMVTDKDKQKLEEEPLASILRELREEGE